MLYTVRFTTRKTITRYDGKGNVISTIETETPVVIKDLPLATAKGYEKCDNFELERQFLDPKVKAQRPHRRNKAEASEIVGTTRPARADKPKIDKREAARKGDLAAAINLESAA